MEEQWFSDVADELARALVDARTCTDACDELLARVLERRDPGLQRRVLDAVAAPAAVSAVLMDLIDQPRPLVIAAARLCSDTARRAVADLVALGQLESAAARAALSSVADSCRALVEAAGLS